MDKLEDTLLVGISFSEKDTGVLIVGRKRKDHVTDIVNAFQGEEALELYKKLITKKGEIRSIVLSMYPRLHPPLSCRSHIPRKAT